MLSFLCNRSLIETPLNLLSLNSDDEYFDIGIIFS